MRELKLKAEKENVLSKKRHKDEVKSWKKELGEERKDKVKLEKKLDELLSEKEIKKPEKKKDEKAETLADSELLPPTTCENCENASLC